MSKLPLFCWLNINLSLNPKTKNTIANIANNCQAKIEKIFPKNFNQTFVLSNQTFLRHLPTIASLFQLILTKLSHYDPLHRQLRPDRLSQHDSPEAILP